MLIASARIVSTYTVFNHTVDEPAHLAAGMEWISAGKYLYEDQHPPLARVMGALGPYLAGERWHAGPDSYFEGFRILGRDAHYGRMLAFGRALGETIATTMVIGNRPAIAASLFKPGYTIASVIANEFTEATTDVYVSALVELGLLLLIISIIINALGRLFLSSMNRRMGG